MVKLPWRRRSTPDPDDWDDEGADADSGVDADGKLDDHSAEERADPIVVCRFQDGTLAVYDDRVKIERPSRSKFDEKWIAINQIRSVTYRERLVIHYIQFEQVDFENDGEGFLSTPVDENTLHFGRGKRPCAREARDAIRERIEMTTKEPL